MKQSKKETSLSEKDALQDMLDIEKLLMTYYNDALIEGSNKAFRKEIMKHFTAHSETQYAVFEQMLNRGYYQVEPAEKSMIEKKTDGFSKILKQISA